MILELQSILTISPNNFKICETNVKLFAKHAAVKFSNYCLFLLLVDLDLEYRRNAFGEAAFNFYA